MSSTESSSTQGLPGLRPIRNALGLRGVDVSRAVGVTPKWLSAIETGSSDCTQKLQRQIASLLCCTNSDLLSESLSDDCLRDIKIAYVRRQLAELEQGGNSKESEVA